MKTKKKYKIKKIKTTKTQLLEIQLLKRSLYSKFNSDKLNLEPAIKNIKIELKKICQVIYKFDIANKKILFLGTPPEDIERIKTLLPPKQHIFMPKSLWFNGIITNPKIVFDFLREKFSQTSDPSVQPLFHFEKKIDLIFLLNDSPNVPALKEIYSNPTPIISLNSTSKLSDLNFLLAYQTQNRHNSIKMFLKDDFFYFLLNSILKKAEIFRQKQIKRNIIQKKIELRRIKQRKKLKNQTKYKKNAFSKKK